MKVAVIGTYSRVKTCVAQAQGIDRIQGCAGGERFGLRVDTVEIGRTPARDVDAMDHVRGTRPGGLKIAPRAPPNEGSVHAHLLGGQDIVVDAVTDVEHFVGLRSSSMAMRRKKAGSGFATPHSADEPTKSTGSPISFKLAHGAPRLVARRHRADSRAF